MALKRNYKPIHEITVKEPTQELDVPFETIRKEPQKDSKKKEDCENNNDHESENNNDYENENEQLTTNLFIPKTLEVLL
jgi:hypothetical protein